MKNFDYVKFCFLIRAAGAGPRSGGETSVETPRPEIHKGPETGSAGLSFEVPQDRFSRAQQIFPKFLRGSSASLL